MGNLDGGLVLALEQAVAAPLRWITQRRSLGPDALLVASIEQGKVTP